MGRRDGGGTTALFVFVVFSFCSAGGDPTSTKTTMRGALSEKIASPSLFLSSSHNTTTLLAC
jgi:hypothetical protein